MLSLASVPSTSSLSSSTWAVNCSPTSRDSFFLATILWPLSLRPAGTMTRNGSLCAPSVPMTPAYQVASIEPCSNANALIVLGCLLILHRCRELRQYRILVPLLLRLQVYFPPMALAAHVPVSPSRLCTVTCRETNRYSGAEIIFRSFLTPTFGRYFTASPSAGVRSKSSAFDKSE